MRSLTGIISILTIFAFAGVYFIGRASGKHAERKDTEVLLKDYQISLSPDSISIYNKNELVSVCKWDSCELSKAIEKVND